MRIILIIAVLKTLLRLKGSLNWPIKEGKVGRGFGENKNDKTKTVTSKLWN